MTEQTHPSASDDALTPASWHYAENFITEAEPIQQARAAAEQFGAPPVTPGTTAALSVLAAATRAKAVVEIGTGTGVSGLAFFAGMAPDGVLTSVDLEAEHQTAARQAFQAAGIAPRRFRLIAGAALSILPNLRDGAYDIVFIDADKLEYVEYVAQAVRLLRPGGLLILDNALWHNSTADSDNEDDETVIIREALDAVKAEDDLLSALVPVGDGLLLAVKREQ